MLNYRDYVTKFRVLLRPRWGAVGYVNEQLKPHPSSINHHGAAVDARGRAVFNILPVALTMTSALICLSPVSCTPKFW